MYLEEGFVFMTTHFYTLRQNYELSGLHNISTYMLLFFFFRCLPFGLGCTLTVVDWRESLRDLI